ncbi:MAG: M28 family peptidase [Bacteroidales bacterium]|nr:M28 family peptidase [Bacteroidales bacterium]
MKSIVFLSLFSILLLFSSCKTNNFDLENALATISVEDLVHQSKTLGSDEFMGRKPCTEGETITLNYLESEYKRIGLEPAVDGSYFQDVSLMEILNTPDDKLKITGKGKAFDFDLLTEFAAFSMRAQKEIKLDQSELIFVGYGIVAPEYNWNDYEGLDVKGKTVVVLVNDPGFGTEDESFFKGNSMTYYGRWTYKYEEAARRGADACFIIHDSKPAGYGWGVVSNGNEAPRLFLTDENNYADRCAVQGWLSQDAAKKLFEEAGLSVDLWKTAAKPGFKAIPMNLSANMEMKNSWRIDTSHNVLGVLRGSKRPDEVIIYSAHWDHFGIGRKVDGDSIYNGAVDNGTSLAWMLEIAEAFKSLKERPERSVLFLATTAEESGLLGASYYVQHPIFELSKTVANINNDLMLPYGRMKDVMITGYGQSELDDYVAEMAIKYDRYIMPDPNPHTGMYFRADHFAFAKAGVPALFARGNCDSREFGKEWALEKETNWLANNYHKVTDEYEEWWDLNGVTDDAKLLFEVGYKLSNESTFPKWKEGSEFKSLR